MNENTKNNKPASFTRERGGISNVNLIFNRVRHGLVLMSFLNLLQRFGLVFFPYWIEIEGLERCKEPNIRDNPDLYQVRTLNKAEISDLYSGQYMGFNRPEEVPDSDYRGVGLYYGKELAACTILRLHRYVFKARSTNLKSNEAHLENMFTSNKFRGKNLAAYTRYQAYKILAENGITTCYSETQCFNKSSQKFKAKLNSQRLELRLYVNILNTLQRNWLLRKYS